MKKFNYYKYLLILSKLALAYCQEEQNIDPHKRIYNESGLFYNDGSFKERNINITFSHLVYLNTNLPNLENMNGLYFSKGNGYITSWYLAYNNENFRISVQPSLEIVNKHKLSLPKKDNEFSKLNDVQLSSYNLRNNPRNFGIKFHYNNLSIGYGNWDQWWGPGIHNTLTISNNAKGFYRFLIETKEKINISNLLSINTKYFTSSGIKNSNNKNFYNSMFLLNLQIRNIEFGLSRQILSGGNEDIKWSFEDAAIVILSHKNLNRWDTYSTYYLAMNFEKSKLKIFYEWGYPLRVFAENYDPAIYYDHLRASNIGLRKYGALGNENLTFGFEYTRILQGIYFNKIPTPNWYDNKKYDYSSYLGRRWAAHSGSDSDDLLIYFGFIRPNKALIYEINYERHGVTYNFPPEVKFESRLSISYKINNLSINLKYENELYEHYGFVDSNNNVWQQTFESGSVQRTRTIVFSIKYFLSSR